MLCIYNRGAVFDWDESNLRKVRAHRIKSDEVEQGLSNSPILVYEQDVQGEPRYEGLLNPEGARGVNP